MLRCLWQTKRENTIIGTINLLKSLNMPEEEIIRQICSLYQIDEEQAKNYLRIGNLEI